MTYRIVVPGTPVSANRMYCNRRGGGKRLSPAAASWKRAVGWAAKEAQVPFSPGRAWDVEVAYFHRDGRRCDADNIMKPILDALTGVLWGDDREVVRQSSRTERDRTNPRVELTLRTIEEEKP